MIVNIRMAQEKTVCEAEDVTALGEWEPFVFSICGIILGKKEQWACDMNEKEQKNVLCSTKISDDFGPMPSKNLKHGLTDPMVGPSDEVGCTVRKVLHSKACRKQKYHRRKHLCLLCKCSFKTSLLRTANPSPSMQRFWA